jgi:hypothetical protein
VMSDSAEALRKAVPILTPAARVMSLMSAHRLLFFLAFAYILTLAWRAEKTPENLLLVSTVGFLTYFNINVGVHENHLFTPLLTAFLLASREGADRVGGRCIAALNAGMANMNLLAFYSMTGEPPGRVLLVDLTVPLAILYVFAWLAIAAHAWRVLVTARPEGSWPLPAPPRAVSPPY